MWLASTLAAFLLTAGTVQAQSVSDKISALEVELQQLKEQQIELKKEATAAAAAMPSFSYRPGNRNGTRHRYHEYMVHRDIGFQHNRYPDSAARRDPCPAHPAYAAALLFCNDHEAVHLRGIAFRTELLPYPDGRRRTLQVPHLLSDDLCSQFFMDLVRQQLVAGTGQAITLFL